MLQSFAAWLDATRISAAMTGYPWLWPVCETLHFMGLTLLIGVTGVLDLRLLGFARGLPIRTIQRLIPWAVGGFVVNLVTGLLFFVGTPFQYLGLTFAMKMLFIGLAGVNVLVFYATGLNERTDAVGPRGDTPSGAKAVGAISLLLWMGVLYWGRMLPYLGDAF